MAANQENEPQFIESLGSFPFTTRTIRVKQELICLLYFPIGTTLIIPPYHPVRYANGGLCQLDVYQKYLPTHKKFLNWIKFTFFDIFIQSIKAQIIFENRTRPGLNLVKNGGSICFEKCPVEFKRRKKSQNRKYKTFRI